MDVTFATPGGREFTLEVWYFATVREMKEAVHAREGIPVASQRLFLAGREEEEEDGQELDDARDTAHYGIVQGSRVVLVLPDDAPPSPSPSPATGVRVAVSAPEIIGPRSVALDDVPASDTVARLKELVQDRTDGALPAARTALFLGKAEMEDGKTLADYGPPADGMDVSAVVHPQAPVASGGGGDGNGAGARNQQRIEVSVMFGETAVALEVGAMDVVRELRKEVERLRLPVRDGGYFFVYKQNVMDEDRTLRWHEIKNGDTIEIFNGTVTGGA
ncbi:polyubiquitin-like [Miscanthus floridulus]|uniref:polyubiquitin-like n=1 Tax=Miscanthus floridulus TaxID=154761 RepID=UPI003458E39F